MRREGRGEGGEGPERGASGQTPGRGLGAHPGGCGARLSCGLCLWAGGSSRLRPGRSSLHWLLAAPRLGGPLAPQPPTTYSQEDPKWAGLRGPPARLLARESSLCTGDMLNSASPKSLPVFRAQPDGDDPCPSRSEQLVCPSTSRGQTSLPARGVGWPLPGPICSDCGRTPVNG